MEQRKWFLLNKSSHQLSKDKLAVFQEEHRATEKAAVLMTIWRSRFLFSSAKQAHRLRLTAQVYTARRLKIIKNYHLVFFLLVLP